MIEGFSLRKCAEILHEEVTHVTLFYWRHKILAALKQIPTESFQGIVEMDETYFLFSEKGKRKITERKPRKRSGKAKYRGVSNDQVCVLVAVTVIWRESLYLKRSLYRFVEGIQFLCEHERFASLPFQI